MSESLERRLSIRECLGLRLHLFVCAWCARYLKQIKSLRFILRGQSSQLSTELVPSLADDSRERISRAPPTISMNMELFTRSWEKLCDAGYESERDFSATD